MMDNEGKISDYIENYKFRKITQEGEKEQVESVAVEKSYDLMINDERITSILASPVDLKELGYGYLISEGFVGSTEQIVSVRVNDREIQAFVQEKDNLEKLLELRSSGCVGVHRDENTEDNTISSEFRIPSKIVFRSLEHLSTNLYEVTSGSHSASLINKKGDLIAQSVDVGRHNTFDKVIGKALLQDKELEETILLASGRQSAGMVRKAAKVGIPIIVSKAAPLSSGIDVARKANLTLICFANNEKFNIFSGEQRIEVKSNE